MILSLVALFGFFVGVEIIKGILNMAKELSGNGVADLCMVIFILPFCLVVFYIDRIVLYAFLVALFSTFSYCFSEKKRRLLFLFWLSLLWGFVVGYVVH